MEYAIAYPEHTRAMILRDTSPDSTNLELVFENARKQTRVNINWDNFERYWTGRATHHPATNLDCSGTSSATSSRR
jgi:proline iminopeptidase